MSDTEVTEDEAEAETEEVDAAPEVDMLHGAAVTTAFGQTILHPTADTYIELLTELRSQGFVQAVDLIGVDYLGLDRDDLPVTITPERFEVVVLLISHQARERIRVRLQVADGESVPTLFDLFPGTEAMEREAFDMFGIEFADHPDLSRILMPETWVGHPLRKDFDIGRIPVQFKDAPQQR